MDKIIVIGGFVESIDLCKANSLEIVGVVDYQKVGPYAYLGDDAKFISSHSYSDVPVMLTPDSPVVRQKLESMYSKAGYPLATIVARDATISSSVLTGEGVIVYRRANISSNVNLGRLVRVNALANIMHDCQIGDYSTVAPNAVVLGGVEVGRLSYIGANATILPGVRVGNSAIVGAGAVVTNDVPDNAVVCGNPARQMQKAK